MAINQKKIVDLRKRRARRIGFAIVGSADRPRLSVFRSNKSFYAQLIDDSKHRTLASVSTKEFAGSKEKKVDLAKMAGTKLADKAAKLGVSAAILDRRSYRYHGRVKAFAEGAREGGLKF